MKFTKTMLGTAMSALFAATAYAGPITLPPGFIQLSDNNAESLINSNGTGCNPAVPASCTLDVGDRLRGIFDINSIEGLNPASPAVFTPFGGRELTGIFDIVITNVTGAPGAFTFQFAASGALGAGVAVQTFTDTSLDYTRLGCTLAACTATATNGSLWASLGIAPGGFWTAQSATNNISLIGALTPPLVGGTYNATLNFIQNNTGYLFAPQTCAIPFGPSASAQVCASGELLGTAGANTPFDSFSNVDFTARVVPEPATLALLGLGSCLAGVIRRRRRTTDA